MEKIFKDVGWGGDGGVVKEERIGEIVKTPKFDDVIYSEKQKEFMKLVLEKVKQGYIHNLLFSGLAGTGKTFSAKMLAAETKKPFVYLTGSLGAKRIAKMLLNLKPNALVLIDEIHNLPEKIAEIIYPAIEYSEVYLEGERHNLDCMFIGTTTEPENLPKPLLDRFMRVEFEEPSDSVIRRLLQKQGLTGASIAMIVKHTLNIRRIKKIIEICKLYGLVNENTLRKVFRNMGINIETGLSDTQQQYLDYLKAHGKASLRALSLVLRRSEKYIKNEVEIELIRKDLIIITSRGRELCGGV